VDTLTSWYTKTEEGGQTRDASPMIADNLGDRSGRESHIQTCGRPDQARVRSRLALCTHVRGLWSD
jgi:hypothetical protein